jgi:hypothetical protein
MSNPKFRHLESRYYQNGVPSISLDYYDPDSHGRDDFSRKQVWFYVYGDEELAAEFHSDLMEMFENFILDSDIDWDLITLYPTSVKNSVNPNLRDLFLDIAGDTGIKMEQVLKRTETIEENHGIDNEKAKAVNVEGSVDVTKNLDGKNVILVDNIVLTGTSMLHGASKLRQNGAENVLAVSLGTDMKRKSDTRELEENEDISNLLRGDRT